MKALKKIRPTALSMLTLLACYVVLFTLLAAAVTPEQYDLKAGEVAPSTITASKDVEDTLTTEKLREEARRAVQPSYVGDSSVQPQVLSDLQEAFNRLLQMKAQAGEIPDDADLTVEELTLATNALAPATAGDDVIEALLRTDAETLRSLYEVTYARVRETLSGKLPEGQESEAIAKLRRDLMNEGYDESLVEAAVAVAQGTIRPNMLLDEETTQLNRDKAAEEVERVIYKKGQNITSKGELITPNQIEMLNSMGMLNDIDFSLYLGVGLLLFLLLAMIYLYLIAYAPQYLSDPKTMALLSAILILSASLSCLVRTVNTYLMPVTLGAMLTTILIKPRLALVVNIALSVITALLASLDSGMFTSTMFAVLLISIVSGSICIVVIRRRPQRYTILLTGVIVSVVGALTALAVGLVNSANQAESLWNWVFWAAGSGILSALLCIALQLVLEWAFNLVTPSKLMELSNPNQPLIRRLLLEAPGTYHHSIIVANLAEAAANAVGADGLLARVGAYYHDIGKLKRPLYFKENQMNDNPHDRTDPRVSTAILTAHPRDGMEMGQKARLPQPVQDIILQHHGDTPVVYFYDRAVKQGGEVDISDFRYNGPRPQSREAAIVMLADTVEAAARSLRDSTPEKLSQLIRKLIRSKMEDGQLDSCPLTFADLNLVCEAFMTVLIGVYHERVEYPNVTVPERPLEPNEEAERTVKKEAPPKSEKSDPAQKPGDKEEPAHAD